MLLRQALVLISTGTGLALASVTPTTVTASDSCQLPCIQVTLTTDAEDVTLFLPIVTGCNYSNGTFFEPVNNVTIPPYIVSGTQAVTGFGPLAPDVAHSIDANWSGFFDPAGNDLSDAALSAYVAWMGLNASSTPQEMMVQGGSCQASMPDGTTATVSGSDPTQFVAPCI